MGEVLVQFDATLTGPDGRRFTPQACGRPVGNAWHGWIEFIPVDGGAAVRTPRETEQPSRDSLMYWAQGLTRVYLDGALARAFHEPVVVERARPIESQFDGPAPHPIQPPAAAGPGTRPVLDPFNVAQQGEDVLVRELNALDASRVRDIVAAYGFTTAEQAAAATHEQLVASVIAGVRRPRADRPVAEARPGA